MGIERKRQLSLEGASPKAASTRFPAFADLPLDREPVDLEAVADRAERIDRDDEPVAAGERAAEGAELLPLSGGGEAGLRRPHRRQRIGG
jgi:hypothetical protein